MYQQALAFGNVTPNIISMKVIKQKYDSLLVHAHITPTREPASAPQVILQIRLNRIRL
jgi:hypothetical protein